MKGKQLKRSVIALILVFVLGIMTGCSNPMQNVSKDGNSESTRFDEFLLTEYKESVTADTMSLHFQLEDPKAFGVEMENPTLGNYTREEFQKSQEDNEEFLKTLESFSYDKLSAKQQKVYDKLEYFLEVQSGYKDLGYLQSPLAPSTGVVSAIKSNFSEFIITQEDDVTDYLAVLQQIPLYMDQMLEFVNQQAKDNIYAADFTINDTIDQVKEVVKTKNNMFIVTFETKINELTNMDETKKASYIKQNKDIVMDTLIPRFTTLITELEALKGKNTKPMGMFSLTNGKKYYANLLKEKTGSEKTPDQMFDFLSNKIRESAMEMFTITQSKPELIESIDSIKYDYDNPDQIIEKLKTQIIADYPAIPETEYEVDYLPKSLEVKSVMAYYLIPQYDRPERNIIKVNKSATKDNPESLFITLAHEGYPGHLYQTNYYKQTDPYPIEGIMTFLGYVEGWATYVETDAYNMNEVADKDLIKLLQINNILNQTIPTLIDIGVNYKGWNEQQVYEYLQSGIGIDDKEYAKIIFEAVISEPAIMASYNVGYFELMELRDEKEEKLGDKFNVKEFNQSYLDVGPAPFSLVEKYMK